MQLSGSEESDDTLHWMLRRTSIIACDCTVALQINYYAMQNVETNFEDPQRFWPQRWLRRTTPDAATAAAARHSQESLSDNSNPLARAFLPYSAGPRSCIGQPLAIMEVKTCCALAFPSICQALQPSACRINFLVLGSISETGSSGYRFYCRESLGCQAQNHCCDVSREQRASCRFPQCWRWCWVASRCPWLNGWGASRVS